MNFWMGRVQYRWRKFGERSKKKCCKMSDILALGIWCPYTLYENLNSNLNFQKTSEHCNHRRCYFFCFLWIIGWRGGGGRYPTSKWQSHLNAITQPGNKIIGLVGSPSTIILYSLLYLNNLITCLILSICPPSGHVSSNYIHLHKQGHTRQNKPLPHF